MMEFIYQLVNKGDLVNAKFLREKCYEKLRIREREFRRQQQQQSQSNDSFDSQQQNDNNNNVGNVTSFKQTTAVNVNTFDIVHLKTWTLLDFKAEHLAEQMTLLDSRLFYKIEVCLNNNQFFSRSHIIYHDSTPTHVYKNLCKDKIRKTVHMLTTNIDE